MNPKKQIMMMVASGKINAKEAGQLLQALEDKKNKREMIFQVWTGLRETPLVEFSIPLKLIRLGMRFVPESIMLKAADHQFNLSAVNWKDIFEIAARGELDEIMNATIDDGDAEVRLRIFLS